MLFDPHAPQTLIQTQEWFAQTITLPQALFSEEIGATPYIKPTDRLAAHQRIQIYHDQYWWRLSKTLHEIYPFLLRLFGYHDFQYQIAFPYLQRNLPTHWSLNLLGNELPEWLQQNYLKDDSTFVHLSAQLDWVFHNALVIPSFPPLKEQITKVDEALTEKTLCLQPHVFLLVLPYDLLKMRKEFLKHPPEHWIDHDFPELPKKNSPYYFAVYRAGQKGISWKDLAQAEYLILKKFQAKASLEEVSDWLEKQPEGLQEAALENLQRWFQEWTVKNWLAIDAS